jgi:transcription antitermination factor NusG
LIFLLYLGLPIEHKLFSFMPVSEESDVRKWYAVYTKPRWEKKVNTLLEKKQLTTWFPQQKVVRQWSDRKKTLEVPLFKSYLFVYVNEQERVRVLQTDGVLNFVYYLRKPAVIRQEEIDVIKSFLLEEEARITLLRPDQLTPDMKVRVNKGIFMDNTGTVIRINKKTVLINLESLGQVMCIEFPVAHVAAV